MFLSFCCFAFQEKKIRFLIHATTVLRFCSYSTSKFSYNFLNFRHRPFKYREFQTDFNSTINEGTFQIHIRDEQRYNITDKNTDTEQWSLMSLVWETFSQHIFLQINMFSCVFSFLKSIGKRQQEILPHLISGHLLLRTCAFVYHMTLRVWIYRLMRFMHFYHLTSFFDTIQRYLYG